MDKLQGGGIYDNGFNAAISQGHLDVVKLLLDEKVDPNLKTTSGSHPLVVACLTSNGNDPHDELVKILLEYGANANAGSDAVETTDFTPIQAACTVRHAELLLEYGANINQQTASRPSPLIIAISKERREMITYLLERG